MVRKLRAKIITISETRDQRNLKILFEDSAMVEMLGFVEKALARLAACYSKRSADESWRRWLFR
jgi:hypothetical protein